MGSTVTTGRMAAAFRAPTGNAIYCLYEEAYEKNCHPHTPHWSAIYIGGAVGAVRKVFEFASACEGGMLQNRSGRMTPEGYLRTWIAELQAPALMPNYCVELYAKKDSYRAPLSAKNVSSVAGSLTAAGCDEEARDLLAGLTVPLQLHEHSELLGRLSDEHNIPAWSLLSDYSRPSPDAERLSDLRIQPDQTPQEPPSLPEALVVSTHGDMILRDPDGTWRCRGWPYEIIGRFVQQLGARTSGYPTNYCTLIRAFRDHLKAASKANPAQLTVRIDRRLATSRWERESIEMAAALPDAKTDGDVIIVPFSTEHDYLLTHQPRAATTWQVLGHDRVSMKPTQATQAALALK